MDSDTSIEIGTMMLLLGEAKELLDEINSRRFWVQPLFRNRDKEGFFAVKFEEIYRNNPQQFKTAVRMTAEVFDLLFKLVEEDLTKNSIRPSISPKQRLFLTLTYLAHGGHRQIYSRAFKMGITTVRRIVNETCEVLWNSLSRSYLPPPTQAEWRRIASDFNETWNMPNCIGAVDGKHIILKCPPNSVSHSYKNSSSVIVLGVCDANYIFTAIDIGISDSQSDGWSLRNSNFGKKLMQGELDVPQDDLLPNSNMKFPYYFIGDAAFPLKPYLMRPYPGQKLTQHREIFNNRLSQARSVIENAFGILTARWRILLNPLYMCPSNVEKIVKAAVVLHNFVKKHDCTYSPPEYVDQLQGEDVISGLWRKEVPFPLRKIGRMSSNNASSETFRLRDQFTEYLVENPI